MRVFHVKFHGRHADWIGKGRTQSVGFYKSESVLAMGEGEAVPKALMRMLARLSERSQDIAIDPQRFELEVCDVADDLRFWHLAFGEKFDFYPIW